MSQRMSFTCRTRPRLAVAVHLLLAMALVPAFILLAPPSRWDHPVLLASLVAVGVIADLSEVVLPSKIRFDATAAIALIALAIAGPLPSFAISMLVLVVGDLTVRNRRLIRAGNLANVAAYGWDTIAAAGVLWLLGAHSIIHGISPVTAGALLAAGVVQVTVNLMVGPMIYGPLYCGHRVKPMLRELNATVPAALLVLALGTATAVLTAPLGVFSLVSFGVTVLVPQIALPLVARSLRSRPVAELDRLAATKLYAQAMGDMLRLGRRERRILAAAAQLMDTAPWGVFGARERLQAFRASDVAEITYAVMYATERFDGTGQPAALEGAFIPFTSRILAVAQAWATLTAKDSVMLPHSHALLDLQARTENEFDPQVVAAAGAVVEAEAELDLSTAAQPRLHALPLPYAVRRGPAPKLLMRLAPMPEPVPVPA